MSGARTLVTAARGTTGRRVTTALREGGHEVTAASRSESGFDWYRPDTYAAALAGVDRVYLVAPSGDPDPAGVMGPFLDLAADRGVHRAVLLSSSPSEPGGTGLGRVHTLVATRFPQWAVLRPTWFMQNLLSSHPHAHSIRERGELLTATDGQPVALIDADDIAAVAVHALTAPDAPNSGLLLTGPEALTYTDVAATISEVTGKTLRHRSITEDELRAYLSSFLPPPAAARMTALDRIIATGSQARVTPTVGEVTGNPARSLRQWVTENRLSFHMRTNHAP